MTWLSPQCSRTRSAARSGHRAACPGRPSEPISLALLFSGIGVFSGNMCARTLGVIAATVNLIANFMFIPWSTLWALAVVTLDVLIIWALTTHGSEMRDA